MRMATRVYAYPTLTIPIKGGVAEDGRGAKPCDN